MQSRRQPRQTSSRKYRKYPSASSAAPGGRPRPNNQAPKRALRYLSRYRREAALPYIFLVIATLSQLMVPRVIGNIIDAITTGYTANLILEQADTLPSGILSTILQRLGTTLDQLKIDQASAEQARPASLERSLCHRSGADGLDL